MQLLHAVIARGRGRGARAREAAECPAPLRIARKLDHRFADGLRVARLDHDPAVAHQRAVAADVVTMHGRPQSIASPTASDVPSPNAEARRKMSAALSTLTTSSRQPRGMKPGCGGS